MKIVVLGAGVIGVTTAYALGRLGHEVHVIDKADAVAAGASHANGAQISYSYADPFANPETFKKIPKYMLGRDKGIGLHFTKNLGYYMWGLRFLSNCTATKSANNLQLMLELARYSKAAMAKLATEIPCTSIQAVNAGKIILARTPNELIQLSKSASLKRSYGFDIETLDKNQCMEHEPMLASWRGEFCGGLFAPGDKVLDPLAFCMKMQTYSENKFGVKFHFNHNIVKLERNGGKITAVQTDKDMFSCDSAIVCLGAGVNKVLKTIGKRHPVYAMRGYSLTLPKGEHTPNISITDPLSKIVFTNLGDKIRIAGFLDANLPEKKIGSRGLALFETAKKLWPDAANYAVNDAVNDDSGNHVWTGLRPMTPSGIPIVGASALKGLYYNIGHGSLGLTLAAGSAEKIAQIVGENAAQSSGARGQGKKRA
ncbi:MAG: hypothetical protein COA43_08205 [Robiginitomaculum sp.]|nr:MAG: hypothetical protein COA43_08205 [Robiginitomaculum sp.]